MVVKDLLQRHDDALAALVARDLLQRHADALAALVASQDLRSEVADEIGVAFQEAVEHDVSMRNHTCDRSSNPLDFFPRHDLSKQAVALAEMIQSSDIDPSTVERARAAIGRDLAWYAQVRAGKDPWELDLGRVEATPAEVEAARIIVELLLGKR